MKWQNKIQKAVRQFMIGRYGNDQLNNVIFGASLLALLLSLLITHYLYIAAVLLLALGYYRLLSRRIDKRARENGKYLQIKRRIRDWFGKHRWMAQQKKDYHIYKCPTCQQKIRIPKGKGKISIRCPKCRTEFIKKS